MRMPEREPRFTPENADIVMTPRDDYERSDIQIRWIILFFVITGASLGLLQFGLWRVVFQGQPNGTQHSDAVSTASVSPPQPRLQAQPLIEYQRHLNDQKRMLESYGWIDQRKGVVRIPITRAMDIMTRSRSPAKKRPPATQTKTEPNQSN